FNERRQHAPVLEVLEQALAQNVAGGFTRARGRDVERDGVPVGGRRARLEDSWVEERLRDVILRGDGAIHRGEDGGRELNGMVDRLGVVSAAGRRSVDHANTSQLKLRRFADYGDLARAGVSVQAAARAIAGQDVD